MKSCHTSSPSSSQRSWKVVLSYALVPGMRRMFMPASRTCSNAARSCAGDGASPTASIGVHTHPRANTRVPLRCRSSPCSSTSWIGAAPAASSRNPTRPASTEIRCSPSPISSRAPYVAGSPWVCGHHSATQGTVSSPVQRTAPSSSATSSAADQLCDPRESSISTLGRVASANWSRHASTARRPSARSTLGRSDSASTTTRRRRSRTTSRHGPTAGGPGAKPGARPSTIVRKKRRLPSATRRVRHRARGRRRARRRGARPRQQIVSSFDRRSREPTSSACAANIESLSSTRSPFR